jgi:hypothetical protein
MNFETSKDVKNASITFRDNTNISVAVAFIQESPG